MSTTTKREKWTEVEVPAVGDLRRYRVHLLGTTPYGQGQAMVSAKREGQSDNDHDEECWVERAHYDEEGYVCLPGQALHGALINAAKSRAEKLKGNKTFADAFMSTVMIETGLSRLLVPSGEKRGERVPLHHPNRKGLEGAPLKGVRRFVPSDGVRSIAQKNAGKRVWRRFPEIPAGWVATLNLAILDNTITEPVLGRHLAHAGLVIGLGVWRPERTGQHGRFVVAKLERAES